jgi:hypothetical protein
MREEDRVCLKIYDALRVASDNLAVTVGRYNIYSAFFHVVMCFCTSAYLNNREKYYGDMHPQFPFVDFSYLSSSRNEFWRHEEGSKKNSFRCDIYLTLVSIFLRVIGSLTLKKVKHIHLTVGVLGFFDILKLTINGFQIQFIKRQQKFTLRDSSYQIEHLRKTVFNIFIENICPIPENLLNSLFERMLESCIFERYQGKPDYVIVGSLAILENRIAALNCKDSGGTVIAFSHGTNSTLGFDEPYVGYGELSFADFYFDYGSRLDQDLSRYQLTLNEFAPKLIRRSSKKIHRLLKSRQIKSGEYSYMSRPLYVPNGFSGPNRYGPFRDVSDATYMRWQKALIKTLPNIIYKVYPSNYLPSYQLFEPNLPGRVIKENLQKIDLERVCDFIILDYFATAHSIASATSKPIIYFNLGLRNINCETKDIYSSRVYWVDIDLNSDLEDQISEAINKFTSQSIVINNDYFSEYDSLAETGMVSDAALLLKEVI